MSRVEDTGLSELWLQDLALKILYFRGYQTGFKMAEALCLPFAGLVDLLMEALKREKFVEVKTQVGFGEGSYQYGITGAGIARAREALERSQYAGAAPVPIGVYNDAIRRQSRGRPTVHARLMRQALADLVLSDKTFNRIGPAVNSGTSLFLYGPPGNGKTSIARAIGAMILQEDMYIPFAIDIDGQVVKMYDSVNHVLAPDEDVSAAGTGTLKAGVKRDPRWVKIKRPFIVVGGELTMAGLDLVFDDVNKFYEAPFQVKANGGVFLVDDFGRQQVRPRDLLNRWIVPLENRIDYLTLHTGRKIEVPFDVMVVFSTNLPPRDLVDEAFLRRLRHKIEVGDPTYEDFRAIFKRVTEGKGGSLLRPRPGVPAARVVHQAQSEAASIPPPRHVRSDPRHLTVPECGAVDEQGAPRPRRRGVFRRAVTSPTRSEWYRPGPLVIAHRGASKQAPENTLAAFRRAAELGADAIELDAKLSADGVVVVHHDLTLDRTTSGIGRLSAQTAASLARLDAGSKFAARFAGEPIPTLAAVFDAVGQRVLINVELTNYEHVGDRLPDAVVALVHEQALGARVLFSSFNPLALRRARRLAPEVPRALLLEASESGLRRGLFRMMTRFEFFHPEDRLVTPDVIEREHRNGRRVNVWTVNDAVRLRALADMGADGLITDAPDVARNILSHA